MRIGDTDFTPWQNFYLLLAIMVSFVSVIIYFKMQQTPVRGENKIKAVLTPPEIKVAKTYSIDELLMKTAVPGKASGGGEVISLSGSPVKESRPAKKIRPGKININEANLNELMRLPDMTKRTAASIIDYREKMGDIWETDELKGLPGVDSNFLNKIRGKVVFE